jgi:fibronectin-binding autotransporter adhesin
MLPEEDFFAIESLLGRKLKNMSTKKPRRRATALGLFALLITASSPNVLLAAGTVTNCDEPSLRQAMTGGGLVTLACDGTIALANTLAVTNTTTIDASGHSVILSGNNTVRVLTVNGAATTLNLLNLTIANGRAAGTNGNDEIALGPGGNGGLGTGGGIYMSGGDLAASNCTFIANAATGGNGGSITNINNSNIPGNAGFALGGAIALVNATLSATNCQFHGNSAMGGKGGDSNGSTQTAGLGGYGHGGAIYGSNSIVVLVNCLVRTNQANGGQAGVYGFPPSNLSSTIAGGAIGGAVSLQGGSLTNLNCTFEGNMAFTPGPFVFTRSMFGSTSKGGAVSCDTGSCIVLGGIFTSNRVVGGSASYVFVTSGDGQGGAIFCGGQLQVANSRFDTNVAIGGDRGNFGGNGDGGSIFCSGTAIVNTCSFSHGFAQGGVGAFGGSLGNRPSGPGRGGAIFNAGSLVLINSGFSDSLACGRDIIVSTPLVLASHAYGGALFNAGSLNATNNTFAGNSVVGGNGSVSWPSTDANGYGGAVFNGGPLVYFVNNTLAMNSARGGSNSMTGAGYGGAICSTNGTVYLLNTILANSPGGANCVGTLTDLGYNISSDGSCNFAGPGSLNNTDPRLGPLGDYGGPTLTMALLAGSPAIDTGSPGGFPSIDQRGHARPFGPACDIGAFESSPPYVIRGVISGSTLKDEVTVTTGAISAFTTNHAYSLDGLAANTYSVTPQSSKYLFLPGARSITVGPDQLGINFTAYRWNALSLDDATNGVLHIISAITNGQTTRLLASPDLVLWSPIATNTIGPSNYWELFLPVGSDSAKLYRLAIP